MKVIEDICDFLNCQPGDIIETVNHFQCFDYILDCADDVLTESIIKKIHSMLKANTSDSRLEWFNVGDYKQRPNMVRDSKTTMPGKVKKDTQVRPCILCDGRGTPQ